MGNKATVIVVEPFKKAEIVRDFDISLENMQRFVGGNVEATYPFEDPIALVCNEENKILNLDPNRALRYSDGTIFDIVFGKFFLVWAPPNKSNFSSIPNEYLNDYLELFKHPEILILTGDSYSMITVMGG